MIDAPTQPAEPIVYVNGAFLPQSQASISVFDHAVLYGDGVFDTSCAWNGHIFMLDAHLDRLYRSIHAAKLAISVTKDELKTLIVETVRRNGLLNAYIKVVVSRGVSPEPLLDPRNCIPSLIIFARPYLSLVDPQRAARGLATKITSVRRIPPECLDPKIKSLNYLNLIMAKLEAIESGCDDAIMLDTQSYVSEGPGYNIFAVVRDNLITPSRSILEGITRTAVFLLAERLGLKVTEGFYTSYDLYTAEEVFFCSTAGGIIPITCIDGRTIGAGEAGPITTKIRSAYRAMLESGEYGTAVYPTSTVSGRRACILNRFGQSRREMAKAFFDSDADLALLAGRTVAILGYGNQGRSQALNLRDSGIQVVVGNQQDASFDRAVADGFDVYDLAGAADRGDVLALLIPDEVMPAIFAESIAPVLRDNDMLIVASGYNLYYDYLKPPPNVDVTMVAPRMIGTGVRELYVNGKGFPSLISVEQDYSGHAMAMTLAFAKGIGSTRAGVFLSSAEEETVCDLFNEHFGYVYELRRAYEVLVEAGYSPEAALLEFYVSGEEAELARAHAFMGLFHQLTLHSQTSQYGQLVTGKPTVEHDQAEKARLHGVIEGIRSGKFAKDWASEQQAGMPMFRRAEREGLTHPMITEEKKLFAALNRPHGDADALLPPD